MGLRVTLRSQVKALRAGAAAKASLNRAKEFLEVDPKPSELLMSRMK